jgi:hypothetical protein
VVAVEAPARVGVDSPTYGRQALAITGAAGVAAGTLLPWRDTAAGATNAWGTSDLAVALAVALDQPLLRLAALALVTLPFLAGLAALLCTAAASRPPAQSLARALSLGCSVVAVTVSLLLQQEPLVQASWRGPLAVCLATALLVTACWWSRRPAPGPPTSEGDLT